MSHLEQVRKLSFHRPEFSSGLDEVLLDQMSFLPHIENWMRGLRTKLLNWSMRLLKEEVWQNAASTSSGQTLAMHTTYPQH